MKFVETETEIAQIFFRILQELVNQKNISITESFEEKYF